MTGVAHSSLMKRLALQSSAPGDWTIAASQWGGFPAARQISHCLTPVKAAAARSGYSSFTHMKTTSRIILGTALIAALGVTGCGKSDANLGASTAAVMSPAANTPAASKPIVLTAYECRT